MGAQIPARGALPMLLRGVVLISFLIHLLVFVSIQAGPLHAGINGARDSYETARDLEEGLDCGVWKSVQRNQRVSRVYPRRTAPEANEAPQSELAQNTSGVPPHRPVTVADAIQMTRVAGSGLSRINYTGAASSDFAV